MHPEKIKVVRIIARLNVGGPAIHTVLLTRKLDSARFEGLLVHGRLGHGEGDMSYLARGIEEHLLYLPDLQREIRPKEDLKAFISLVRLLYRERPDIVHTHTAKAGAIGRAAALAVSLLTLRRQRLVHTFHGNVLDGYFSARKTWVFRFIERTLARFTDTVVAISPLQAEELVRVHRIAPKEKIRIIRLGFDLGPFLGLVPAPAGRGGRFTVGIVGRLVPIKNHAVFLSAAALFTGRCPDIPVRFAIAGDGELREKLEARARETGIATYMDFMGWQRDLPAVYNAFSAAVLCSNNEGTPVSLIEAMASGVPVVSTDVGGVRDLLGEPPAPLEQGGFAACPRGLLCRPGDPAGLAAALEHLARRPEEAEKMAARARGFAEKTYGEKRLVGEIESLYEELTGRRCAVPAQ
jgi:glycosyltransferase involved in cell wall biosynthesis